MISTKIILLTLINLNYFYNISFVEFKPLKIKNMTNNFENYNKIINTPSNDDLETLNKTIKFIQKNVNSIKDKDIYDVLKNNSNLGSKSQILALQIYSILKDAIDKNLSRKMDYLKITEIIKKGKKLKIDINKNLPKGMNIAYDEKTNTVFIKNIDINSVIQRSIVLHEMTHAADDINPVDSPLKEDKDNKLYRYEGEINSYIAESEYRYKYLDSIEETELYNLSTLQQDSDNYIDLLNKNPNQAQQQLENLKKQIIKIYTRNLSRINKTNTDYQNQLRNSDGIK